MLDNFRGQYDHVLLNKQPKWNDFKGHRPPPPPEIQDATYTKHVYRHSKLVSVESCIEGGGGGAML